MLHPKAVGRPLSPQGAPEAFHPDKELLMNMFEKMPLGEVEAHAYV